MLHFTLKLQHTENVEVKNCIVGRKPRHVCVQLFYKDSVGVDEYPFGVGGSFGIKITNLVWEDGDGGPGAKLKVIYMLRTFH